MSSLSCPASELSPQKEEGSSSPGNGFSFPGRMGRLALHSLSQGEGAPRQLSLGHQGQGGEQDPPAQHSSPCLQASRSHSPAWALAGSAVASGGAGGRDSTGPAQGPVPVRIHSFLTVSN